MGKINTDISWLVRLRWFAVVGQFVGVLVAAGLLELSFPRLELYTVVGLTLISNLVLEVLQRRRVSFSHNMVGAVLLLDTTLLAMLLYFSGGSSNPFSTLFLVHITLAAVVLGSRWTWLLAGLATTYYVLLFKFFVPVAQITHEHGMHMGESYSLHLQGMLIAFVLTAALVTYFLDKVTRQIKLLEKERFDQSRLASLATLSAGAAHELGSPLAAISIASEELELVGGDEQVDLALIRELSESITLGVSRCKDIIATMGGELGRLENVEKDSFLLAELVDDVCREFSDLESARIDFELPLETIQLRAYYPMLKRCLHEMLHNALDASSIDGRVKCEICVEGGVVRVAVVDHGYGITEDGIAKATEPFYSTKDVGQGMGLGLYLVELFAKSMKGQRYACPFTRT